MQQSVCRVLGVLDYNAHPHGLQDAIQYLLGCVNKQVYMTSFGTFGST